MALPTTINQKKLSELVPLLKGIGIAQGGSEIDKFGTVLEKMLDGFGITLTSRLKKNAIEKGNTTQGASSGLVNSIRHTVEAVGKTGARMQIHIDDYYTFVDLGVDGKIRSNGSPYKYKSKMPPRDAMEHYIITKGGLLSKLIAKNPEQYKGLSKKVQVERLAKLMQRNKFLYGFKGKKFYSEIVTQENLNILAEQIGEVTGKMIVFNLKNKNIA